MAAPPAPERSPALRAAVLRTAATEQGRADPAQRPMSGVLWDMFTGGASYRDILRRTLAPSLVARVVLETALAAGRLLTTSLRSAAPAK